MESITLGNITLINFIILILATFRLSHLIANEDGPYEILDKVRHFIGVRIDQYGRQFGNNNLSIGLICPLCNSVWIGIILIILFYTMPDLSILLMLPFSLSGFVLLIDRLEPDNG